MKTREVIAPQTGAKASDLIVLNSNNVMTVIGFGFNAGADVIPIEIAYDELNTLFEPCVVEGVAQELSANTNILTIYGPGVFRLNKGITAEAVGASTAREQG